MKVFYENVKYTMLIENVLYAHSGSVKLDSFSRVRNVNCSLNTIQTDYSLILFKKKQKKKNQSALVNFVLNI